MGKKKYYADTCMECKTITHRDGDIPQIMNEMINENGVIPVQFNSKDVMKTISKNMYTSPTACIREYVNNEARPCREAVSKGYKDVSVYITVNAISRNIIIEGRNSMGMSLDTFKEVYVVLGRSGNFDGEESGQFGFGRASYTCLSDVMIFETLSRETNEKFGFVGKSGVAFEPIPSKKLSIKQYGTKITMNMRKEIDLTQIVTYIKNAFRFLSVNVFLEIVGNIYDGFAIVSDISSNVQQIGPVSLIDAIGGHADIHIDNDDYELVGTCDYRSGSGNGWDYNLIGMPICTRVEVLYTSGHEIFRQCIINIKNERKYMPTSSRDSLTTMDDRVLNYKIQSDLKKYLGKINITCMHDYYNNQNIIDTIYTCSCHATLSVYGFNESVIEFVKLLSTRFTHLDYFP